MLKIIILRRNFEPDNLLSNTLKSERPVQPQILHAGSCLTTTDDIVKYYTKVGNRYSDYNAFTQHQLEIYIIRIGDRWTISQLAEGIGLNDVEKQVKRIHTNRVGRVDDGSCGARYKQGRQRACLQPAEAEGQTGSNWLWAEQLGNARGKGTTSA